MPRKMFISTALAALATGLLTAGVAQPASAWSETVQYDCSGPGFGTQPSYRFAGVYDTDVPATLPYGSERTVAWQTHIFVPEDFRAWAVSQGFTTMSAGANLSAAVDGVGQPVMYQSTLGIPVPTTAGTWTWDPRTTTSTVKASALGQHSLSVTGLGLTVAFGDAHGPRLATSATCIIAPPDEPVGTTLVDTYAVVAATTSTTLAVTGDTATATVTSNGTPPVGAVSFSVGGWSVSMDVTGGKATAKLPTLAPGTHEVTAAFVPNQPTQLTSSRASASYVVAPFVTRTVAYASYRQARHVLKAQALVTAEDDSPASGHLTFVLKRNGRTVDNATVRLSREGQAVARFREIRKPGRYVVVARYLGTRTYQQSQGRARLRIP